MIRELTQAYVAAFNAKDIEAVGRLLADDVALEDPVVKRIEGKAAVLAAVAGIFASCTTLEFTARNIFVDGDASVIEFSLTLDATHLKGADIIDWREGRIAELRAYLDIPKA
jgi:ketosteroid isomerase-like protein